MHDCCFIQDDKRFRFRVGAFIVENDCVLLASNELVDYYYSVGGGVHLGESTSDAVLREVYEETGVHYKIDHLAIIHETFYPNTLECIEARECHEICFYFLMKSRGSQELHSNSTALGVKEEMYWIPICDLDDYKVFPAFLKDYLTNEHEGMFYIFNDERL